MKKPQIQIERDVHTSLKKYCALKGKNLSHVASKVLGDFLETKHEEIESEGSMAIEGQREKPKTIIEALTQEM